MDDIKRARIERDMEQFALLVADLGKDATFVVESSGLGGTVPVMQTSAIECQHLKFTANVIEHPWEDGSGIVVDAAVTCMGCGVQYHNARAAREAGVFDQADAARRAALDSWDASRALADPLNAR